MIAAPTRMGQLRLAFGAPDPLGRSTDLTLRDRPETLVPRAMPPFGAATIIKLAGTGTAQIRM